MSNDKPEQEQEQQQIFYWLDSASGEVFLTQDQLPRKKSHLYLVVNREKLFFNSFSLHTKKHVKDSHVLSIQKHFLPFKSDFMNIIYSAEKHEDKHFYSWVGPLKVNVESFFYDEIPESLIFKGDPVTCKKYQIFVFQRVSGFEIIYYNGADFYSLFEKEAYKIGAKIVLLARKFSIQQQLNIFTDTDIPHLSSLPPHYHVTVDLASSHDKYFFLPDFFPVKKRYSNISQNRQLKSMKNILHQWDRNLTIISLLLLLVFLVNIVGLVLLKQDNTRLKQKFAVVEKMDRMAETIRFRLNKIAEKIRHYPDHMLYLKTIAETMDEESTLISYSLEEGRITIEGYAPDSLALLTRLQESHVFKEVRFKTTVIKSELSQKEKFEIELLFAEPVEKG